MINDKTLNNKRTQLRAALLNLREKDELHRLANATGIAGGVGTLNDMIYYPEKISIMDIGILGMHFGIDV
jgi:hypothetical protein